MIRFQIRDTKTGEARIGEMTTGFIPTTDFVLTEGELACDCNRHLLFERVHDPNYSADFPCGDERYALDWVEVDGRRP